MKPLLITRKIRIEVESQTEAKEIENDNKNVAYNSLYNNDFSSSYLLQYMKWGYYLGAIILRPVINSNRSETTITFHPNPFQKVTPFHLIKLYKNNI